MTDLELLRYYGRFMVRSLLEAIAQKSSIGAIFRVESIAGRGRDGQSNSDVVGRLADLGLFPGEYFEYRGSAPFGEPHMIEIRGSTFALRTDEAQWISVSTKDRA